MLKDLRLSKKYTQKQMASILGISLRSYKQYENDPSKRDTFKYKYLCNQIESLLKIDESHGVLLKEEIIEKVNDVFKNYDIEFCYLFGSYSRGEATPKSDVDLLVSTKITGMAFYGLAETLRESLHKNIDLLNVDQLLNNKELLNNILKEGIKIYG